ncbi:MAG: hypothetical protein V2A73_13030, partial [Pseudomonadota bacterium]
MDDDSRARTAFRDDQYEAAYPAGIERHYWHQYRNALIRCKLGAPTADRCILEIGCGRGHVVDYLRRHGYESWG